MGGLYEKGILGSGDNIMALSLIQRGLKSVNENSTEDYKNSVIEFQERVKNVRLGFVPGKIRHFFNGKKSLFFIQSLFNILRMEAEEIATLLLTMGVLQI
jgi:hypothetical protein